MERIVSDETWWKAQQVLDDTERVTNTSGSTKRKHLGSGLYRCGYADEETGEVCGRKVTGAPRGYKCAGHIVRSGAAIDDFVMTVIDKRLARKDARVMVEVPDGGPHAAGIDSAISDQRARILRAEADYDSEIIEARDLKRVRDAAETRIQELEAEKLMQGRAGALSPILGVDDPAAAFREASLASVVRPSTPSPRSRFSAAARAQGFRTESVVVNWR
ncbi:hypothetical protein [Ornithinimicrobium sp. INDO-MA30-4]|uniref:hypothetical protein n=1 Tax=Ornithinimicrobium sp. INDO-MA30-4 TaxID=2908651 RepID=UPI001F2BC04E|nr:hypothetical protein [Ornithinimicrobium sp. INDO-MA30-4]UJH69404.1 hypothetical protein L0A91_08160 [Ornithinimicrobium sp. INDO-MA30-4]